jgi:pyruvate kinase
MKKTKIICSIGPSSCPPDTMEKMVNAGMNVARINFSHATLEEKQGVVASVHEVRKRTGKNKRNNKYRIIKSRYRTHLHRCET